MPQRTVCDGNANDTLTVRDIIIASTGAEALLIWIHCTFTNTAREACVCDVRSIHTYTHLSQYVSWRLD